MDKEYLDSDNKPLGFVTQWDINRKIKISPIDTNQEIFCHFYNEVSTRALVVKPEKGENEIVVNIPNILLQKPYKIFLAIYEEKSQEGKTTNTFEIPVMGRAKPEDYTYEENIDYVSWVEMEAKAEKQLQELQKISKEINDKYNSGAFKGEKGDAGVPGKDGKDGKDGVDGKNGLDGKDGKDGPQGPKGDTGLPGKDGLNGKDGAQGIPGKDGLDGVPGKNGIDGAPGKDGLDGKNGLDGKTPVKGVDYWTDKEKTDIVKEVVTDSTNEFNINAVAKIEEFNKNAVKKTEEFNKNSKSYGEKIDSNVQKIDNIEKNIFDSGFAGGKSPLQVRDGALSEIQEVEIGISEIQTGVPTVEAPIEPNKIVQDFDFKTVEETTGTETTTRIFLKGNEVLPYDILSIKFEDKKYKLFLEKYTIVTVLDKSNFNWGPIWGKSGETIAFLNSRIFTGRHNESENTSCSNKFISLTRSGLNQDQDTEWITQGSSYFGLRIKKSRLTTADRNGFSDWLQAEKDKGEPVKIIYKTDNPEEVKKIELAQYDDFNLMFNDVTNIITTIENTHLKVKYYRNFISTIRNLQVDNKGLQAQLRDLESRLSALEAKTTK